MARMWNYDKPHRCPECHVTWTCQAPVWEWDDLDGITPRWWKTYTCRRCGARFTGRYAWLPMAWIKTRWFLRDLKYYIIDLKWRLTR